VACIAAIRMGLHSTPPDQSLVRRLTEALLNQTPTVAGPGMAGVNEVLYGRAGYLLCLSALYRYGLEVEEGKIVAAARRALTAVLSDGRRAHHYGKKSHDSQRPLWWEFHGKAYLGAAHGDSGILYAILCWYHLLDDEEKRLFHRSVSALGRRLLHPLAPHAGHWDETDAEELMHWCHGPPGHVSLFAKAATVFGSAEFAEVARVLASRVFEHGLLRKGLGLCHGVCGNAYALLAVYRMTGDTRYLHEAQAFCRATHRREFVDAVASYDDPQRRRKGVPDTPLSLMEGSAGVGCFLLDLVAPFFSSFPGFETSTSPPVMDWAHRAMHPLGMPVGFKESQNIAPGVWTLPVMDPGYCDQFLEAVYAGFPPHTRKVDALRINHDFEPVVRAVTAHVERFVHSVMLPSNWSRLSKPPAAADAISDRGAAPVPPMARFRRRGTPSSVAREDEEQLEATGPEAEWNRVSELPHLRVWRAYVIRYDTESHPSIQSHSDACDITFNLCLRRTCKRGHLVFNASSVQYRHTIGDAVVFWGDKVHHTHSVAGDGERAQLVLLLNFRSSAQHATPTRRIDASILTDDVVQHIFAYLPLRDLATAGYACRRFYFLSGDDAVWFTKYISHTALSAFLPADQAILPPPTCVECDEQHTAENPLARCTDCGGYVHEARHCDSTLDRTAFPSVYLSIATTTCRFCQAKTAAASANIRQPLALPHRRLRGAQREGHEEAVKERHALNARADVETLRIAQGWVPWKCVFRFALKEASCAAEELRQADDEEEKLFWRAIIGCYDIHNFHRTTRDATSQGDDDETFETCYECLG
jgi:hypothetical protein